MLNIAEFAPTPSARTRTMQLVITGARSRIRAPKRASRSKAGSRADIRLLGKSQTSTPELRGCVDGHSDGRALLAAGPATGRCLGASQKVRHQIVQPPSCVSIRKRFGRNLASGGIKCLRP